MYTITFQFEQAGIPSRTFARVRPAQTLLEVALDHSIGLQHDCGGVCACSTCHLYIEEGGQYLAGIYRREQDYLARTTRPRVNSRLGCQCLLFDGRGKLIVTLPDPSLKPTPL